jgi:N-dimethylarginine dimethylaminohydrolase
VTAAPLGAQSETGRLRRVLMKRPAEALGTEERIADEWRSLGYPEPPLLEEAAVEHAHFVSLFERAGVSVDYLPADPDTGLDSLYARDAAITCARGVILANMGKAARRGEPQAMGTALASMGVPVYGSITGEGRIEGGDVVWLNERTVAVGQGHRTNAEGIRQLRALLAADIDELLVAHLPHWHGPGECLHLMSLLSPVDRDLAVVYSPLMSVAFRDALCARGIAFVEVPESEFASQGPNVLALAPRRCLVLEGNPLTRAGLERAGCDVVAFPGQEICHKGGGGPTCLARPLVRDAP